MKAVEQVALCGGVAVPGLSSAATVTWLTKQWADDHAAFQDRDFVHVWADGVHPKVRLGQAHSCVLVLLGVHLDGTKELIALAEGLRESTESRADLLRDCRRRGMRDPELVVGDGAMGLWKALAEVFPATRRQRCCVHRSREKSTFRRDVVGLADGEEIGGCAVTGGRRDWEVAVGLDQRVGFADDVSDRGPADVAQRIGQDVEGAQFPQVEHEAAVIADAARTIPPHLALPGTHRRGHRRTDRAGRLRPGPRRRGPRTSNRIRGLLTPFHPSLERVLGPRLGPCLDHQAVTWMLERYGSRPRCERPDVPNSSRYTRHYVDLGSPPLHRPAVRVSRRAAVNSLGLSMCTAWPASGMAVSRTWPPAAA